MKYLFAILLFTAGYGLEGQIQKYGHVNSLNIIDGLEASKHADAKLKKMQEQKVKGMEGKQEELNLKVSAYYKEVNNGNLSPVQSQQLEVEIQKIQQEISDMEKQAQRDLLKMREELIAPILVLVQDAITKVAKDGKYSYIFDESTGFILFNRDSEDVSQQVLEIVNAKSTTSSN